MLNRGNNCFDHEVGSLEPEKLADFVVLDKDPLTVEVDKIKKIRVLETWMDGTKVFIGPVRICIGPADRLLLP